MRILFKKKDGGPQSTVTGYWLIEWKSVFSIVLLKFSEGSRESYHSHAFNALTWWLVGEADEYLLNGPTKKWLPSFQPKYTPRSCFHKVFAIKTTWALSVRGPWKNTWKEFHKEKGFTTLTYGRQEVLNEAKP